MIAEEHFNLANALQGSRRFEEAVTHYRLALEIEPNFFHASNNLGKALQAMGRPDEAITAYQNALRFDATVPEIHFNLGNALLSLRRLDEAVKSFDHAMQLRPEYAEAINGLGHALWARVRSQAVSADRKTADSDKSLLAYRRALALDSNCAERWLSLGDALRGRGEIDQAIAHYRRAAQLRPDPSILSALLYSLHFHPDYGPDEIHREHATWNEQFAKPLAPANPQFPNTPDPDRRLRIGYVSPDFHDNPIGRFLLPLVANQDHLNHEIYCYADLRRVDALTWQFRAGADVWRETGSLSDERLAALIRSDRIDVLVDVTMHLVGSRLLAFARKPAPVQVTYLAYPGTTGLAKMDYRLSDPHLDPRSTGSAGSRQARGMDESVYVERTVRLSHTFWCFEPSAHVPSQVLPPPVKRNGFVTFGCLNSFSKVTSPTVAMWTELLLQVPSARLLLHTDEGSHRTEFCHRLERDGVDPFRIEFVGYLPLLKYFEQYHRIDIALDPTPYCGGTTTLDALWMGVPVVSLAGTTGVSRSGLSILSNAGLAELVASDASGYVRIARELAVNVPRLVELRSGMRQRLRGSPLMDVGGFARSFEAALRGMWREFCTKTQPEASFLNGVTPFFRSMSDP